MNALATATWSLTPILAVCALIAALATLHLWLVPMLLRIEARADRRHIAEAIELTQADIAAIIAWDELEFAASVLADLDALDGGEWS